MLRRPSDQTTDWPLIAGATFLILGTQRGTGAGSTSGAAETSRATATR
jgi:hypothetical protein